MKDKEFEEFKEKWRKYFSELDWRDIRREWRKNTRNAYLLGIWDSSGRRRNSKVRKEFVQWLDAHPDKWTKDFTKQFGGTVSVDEFSKM